MKFKIINETNENLNFYKNKEIKKIIKEFLKIDNNEKFKKYNFSIIFVSDDKIKKLNKKYRGIDVVTDVLSFPINFDSYLGEIYISFNVMQNQAKSINNSLNQEFLFLTTHSLLHLVGYDHSTFEEEKTMIDKQNMILGRK